MEILCRGDRDRTMMKILILIILAVFSAFAVYVIRHEKRKREAIMSIAITLAVLCTLGVTAYKSIIIANAEGGQENNTEIIKENPVTNDDPEADRYNNNEDTNDDPDAPENLNIDQYIEENADELNYSLNVDWNDYEIVNGNQRKLMNCDSKFGITVSYFQKDIDWKKVKDAGVEYAIIRVGYRGLESGDIFLDDKFNENIEEAQDNGIMVGVYFYSQAINKAEVDEEIEFLLKNIKDYDISYPVGINLDIVGEDIHDNYRAKSLTMEEYAKLISYYALRIAEEGYVPMIYGTEEEFQEIEEYTSVKYLKWLYSGHSQIENGENCVMWQYRNYSNIDGIGVKTSISFSVFDMGTTE